MTAFTGAARADPVPLRRLIQRHPLVAYFVLAFVGTWLFIAPILLSTYAGPFPAALIVTRVVDGQTGMHQLLRRIVQWRVGAGWYLLVLVGYPLVFLLGLTTEQGAEPMTALVEQRSLLLSYYLPTTLFGLLLPSLGEEPGWRGFALPRLQQYYGPLVGSLLLGSLHGLWHLPAYMIPGAILPGGFDFTVFVANTLAIIASTVVWTWFFNNAAGSIFFAMYVHAVSNANSGLMPMLISEQTGDPWLTFKLIGVCALFIIALTRGRLSYGKLP